MNKAYNKILIVSTPQLTHQQSCNSKYLFVVLTFKMFPIWGWNGTNCKNISNKTILPAQPFKPGSQREILNILSLCLLPVWCMYRRWGTTTGARCCRAGTRAGSSRTCLWRRSSQRGRSSLPMTMTWWEHYCNTAAVALGQSIYLRVRCSRLKIWYLMFPCLTLMMYMYVLLLFLPLPRSKIIVKST